MLWFLTFRVCAGVWVCGNTLGLGVGRGTEPSGDLFTLMPLYTSRFTCYSEGMG